MDSDNSPLFTALVAFQRNMENVAKDKTANTGKFGYKYADIAGVIEAIKEPLAAQGLCYLQVLTHIDGKPALTTTLAHESGSYISGTVPLMGDLSDPQKFGGIVTYYRRYQLLGILGLATDDDDAQSVSRAPQQRQPDAQTPAPRQSPQTTPANDPAPSQGVEGDIDWSDLWGKVLRPRGIMSAQRLTELIGPYESLSAAQVKQRVDDLDTSAKWTPPTEQPENNPNGITPAQLKFARELLLKKGMDDKAWPAWAAYTLDWPEDQEDYPRIHEITKAEASRVIEELKSMPDNPGMQAILEASGR
jgi:hypothetical protein